MKRNWYESSYLISNAIFPRYYRKLRELKLADLYIDDDRLRSFVATQSDTLVDFDMLSIKLTCGSWTKIFSTLRTAIYLEGLRLAGLYQKSRKGAILRVGAYYPRLPYYQVVVLGAAAIDTFLNESMGTVQLHRRQHDYWEIEMFAIPNVSVSVDPPTTLA